MTELSVIFARLGLDQYLDSFIVEGFDSWATILDIQEGDLDALGVKLGHRRKLQREIANQQGLFDEQHLGSPSTEGPGESEKNGDDFPNPSGHHDRPGTETKRKYKRHPKPDKNAPERPPSAYVIFSNTIREEVRGRHLSFTDIAKLVGDRWQKLSPDDREPFEAQASASKENFDLELAQYKKTSLYSDYIQYIADFKAKHAVNALDGKRLKLADDSRGGIASNRPKEVVVERRGKLSTTHGRDASVGSMTSAPPVRSTPSPKGGSTAVPATMTEYGMSTHLSRTSPLLSAKPAPVGSDHRGPRIPSLASIHASAPSHAHQVRGDFPELHSRTGQLSLHTLSNGIMLPTGDPYRASGTPSAVPTPLLQRHSSSLSSGPHSDSSGTPNAPPITPADEPWRYPSGDGKVSGPEWPPVYNPLPTINHGGALSQLPPLQQACERLYEMSHDPNQRTLPYPAHSSSHGLKAPSRAYPPPSMTVIPPGSPMRLRSGPCSEGRSPLENSENDAANALTVLSGLGR